MKTEIHFPLQNQIFPEELSAGGSMPPHQRRADPLLDGPRLVQPLLTSRNGEFQAPLIPSNAFHVTTQADSGFVLQIKRENVEQELLPGAVGEELIYHRGL